MKKFEEIVKVMEFGKFELSIFLISYVLLAVFKDLGLTNALNIASALFLMMGIYMLCWFVCCIVLFCMKRHDAKKSNIEKLIEEETKENK